MSLICTVCDYVATAIDRRQAEVERELLLKSEQKAREEAERANSIKDEFMAVLSHELRSPLNPVLGWSQLLRNSKFDRAMLEKGLETVDDDTSTREFLAFALQQYGAIVSAVASAPEALAALTQLRFGILLSDIAMPEMDGYTLMRQVRASSLEHNGEILAVALTAYASEPDRQLALSVGFQGHIAKPVNLSELIRLIAKLFDLP